MKKLYDFWNAAKIPFRNIWRNRRRTSMTMAGIAIATLSLILLGGYIQVMDMGLRENAISNQFGHFQIARTGYFDAENTSFSYLMDENEFKILEKRLYEIEGVDYVNYRLHISGMIGNFKDSTVFLGTAGLAEWEVFMSPSIIRGEPLSAADPTGIVIGESMAEKLDIDIGSTVLLFFASDAGTQEAVLANIRGLYRGMFQEQEANIIYIPLTTAWELMLEPRVHNLLVFLRDEQEMSEVITEIEGFINKNQYDFEVKPWNELAVYYKQIVSMFNGFLLVAGIIFFIIIIFNISNTMYMVINERTREIGTLRAMGDSKAEIVRMLFGESFLMGIIGAVIGTLAAYLLIPVINSLNLTLPPGPGQLERIPVQLIFDVKVSALIILTNIFIASIASILPALRAAKIQIVDALRHV